ncbi:MAG TPA: hypothetical protein VEA58_13270 [Anaerovoracaceae bacterium]|nr:hypothetical protein [Anaerovoracaceae bacterium]
MIVKIEIKYYGKYYAKTGLLSEEIFVDDEMNHAYKAIMDYLKRKRNIDPPFLLMIRGEHVMGAIKKGMQLREGDVFSVIPFLSGG